MTTDVQRHLTELGSATVPPPDPEFATQLELSLRQMRLTADTRTLRPRRWPATVAAVTFSVAAIAFGLTTINSSPSPISISAASGASVLMPDGEVVAAEPGLDLPHGARVEVGPTGSATIGDVDLGPGEVADITQEGIVRSEPAAVPQTTVQDPSPSNPIIAASTSEPAATEETGVPATSEPTSDTPPVSGDDPATTGTTAVTNDRSATDSPTSAPDAAVAPVPTSAVREDDRTSATSTTEPVDRTTTTASKVTTTITTDPITDPIGSDKSDPGTISTTTEPKSSASTSSTTEVPGPSTSEPTPVLILGEYRDALSACLYSDGWFDRLLEAVAAGLISTDEAAEIIACLVGRSAASPTG